MKKDKNLVKQEADKLYQEIVDNGYDKDIAKKISDDMRDKGGYLFNKSHSQSYAIICFITAYLKHYYPVVFFKALFNLNKDKSGMINKYIVDAKDFNIEILPPDINKSEINFSISDNKILFGLSAIKGIGELFAEEIVNERKNNGNFTSLQDFVTRTKAKKTQIISLIKAGAFPTKNKKKTLERYFMSEYPKREYKPVKSIPSPYSKLLDYNIDINNYRDGKVIDKDRLLQDLNIVKERLFNETEDVKLKKYQFECSEKYLKNEEFWEFEALQIFLNNNPFDKVYNLIQPFEEINLGDKCTIVGIISKVQKKKDKNKKQFAYVNIYSSFGLIEGVAWHSVLAEYEDLLKNGSQVALLVRKDGEDKVVIEKVKSYNIWLQQKNKQR